MTTSMDARVEGALAACGRDRVLHRDGAAPSVAIRYDVPSGASSPDGVQRFLVRDGATLDDAGRQAATAFAAHLRVRAREIVEWADRIERALLRGEAL